MFGSCGWWIAAKSPHELAVRRDGSMIAATTRTVAFVCVMVPGRHARTGHTQVLQFFLSSMSQVQFLHRCVFTKGGASVLTDAHISRISTHARCRTRHARQRTTVAISLDYAIPGHRRILPRKHVQSAHRCVHTQSQWTVQRRTCSAPQWPARRTARRAYTDSCWIAVRRTHRALTHQHSPRDTVCRRVARTAIRRYPKPLAAQRSHRLTACLHDRHFRYASCVVACLEVPSALWIYPPRDRAAATDVERSAR